MVERNRCSHLSTSSDDQSFPTADPIKCAAFSFNPVPLLERHRRLDRDRRARDPAPAASTTPKERKARDLTDSNTDGDGQGSDIPQHLDLKNYVLQKHYHPTYDTHNHFHVVTTETLVLVSHLRPAEQNVTYESLIAQAPKHKVKEYYELHLARLKAIREEIGKHDAVLRGLLKEWKSEAAALKGGWVKSGRAKTVGRIYKTMIKEGGKLRAWERGVGRLVGRCEEIVGGQERFEKVDWRRCA